MKVRFLADNDLRKAIVRAAVRREPELIWEASISDDWTDRVCLVPSLATIVRSGPD